MAPSSARAKTRNEGIPCNVETHLIEDDDTSCHSDGSVGDITETSISDETETERVLTSAIAATISEKQQDISLAFASMVTKMALMIEEKETENERLLGHFSLESQQRRQEQAEKCTKAVNSMAKKQSKLARQFEKLILDLEESNRQKELERVQLKKQISQMKDRMQKMKISMNRHSCYNNGDRRNLVTGSKPPPIPTPRSRSCYVPSSCTPSVADTQITETFSIREISFSSTIVDVSELIKSSNDDAGTICSMSEDNQASGENVRFIL
jgi:hypothetical protein